MQGQIGDRGSSAPPCSAGTPPHHLGAGSLEPAPSGEPAPPTLPNPDPGPSSRRCPPPGGQDRSGSPSRTRPSGRGDRRRRSRRPRRSTHSGSFSPARARTAWIPNPSSPSRRLPMPRTSVRRGPIRSSEAPPDTLTSSDETHLEEVRRAGDARIVGADQHLELVLDLGRLAASHLRRPALYMSASMFTRFCPVGNDAVGVLDAAPRR